MVANSSHLAQVSGLVSLQVLVKTVDLEKVLRKVTQGLPDSLSLDDRTDLTHDAFDQIWAMEANRSWPARWEKNSLQWRIYRRAIGILRSITPSEEDGPVGNEIPATNPAEATHGDIVALWDDIRATLYRTHGSPEMAERACRCLQMAAEDHSIEEMAEVEKIGVNYLRRVLYLAREALRDPKHGYGREGGVSKTDTGAGAGRTVARTQRAITRQKVKALL